MNRLGLHIKNSHILPQRAYMANSATMSCSHGNCYTSRSRVFKNVALILVELKVRKQNNISILSGRTFEA